MNDKVFVDTNILVYSIANDKQKRKVAEKVLLNNRVVVTVK